MIDTPTFGRAAVAAPHVLAAQSGRAVLAEGGNALEAMVAMAATIAVVYPHMNGIGGDGFWLVHEPGGKIVAIEACGPAGALATRARYRDKGYDSIPPRGVDAALTVPGAIGGWQAALALAARHGGKLPLSVLLGDAARFARDGYPVSESEARYKPKEFAGLIAAPGFRETFMPKDDRAPGTGELHKLPALAATFEHLTSAGLDDFYRGDVARELAADLERAGAPVTRADFAGFRAKLVEALTLQLRGVTIANFPPPTQGLASLVLLGIFDRMGVREGESVAHLHGLIEAAKRAMRLRDRVVTDPARLRERPERFLASGFLEAELAKIAKDRAAPWPAKAGDGDTIWMGAIDGDGLAVSYIQSVYWEYGSGVVSPATGVLLQNRGMAFSLDPASLNVLEPGRLPIHTLNPALAMFDDGRIMSYGAMGGDGQPQFQAQIFARHVHFGMGLADALDAPRFLLGKTWGSTSTTVKIEPRFDPDVIAKLREMGHEIEDFPGAYVDAAGHAGMLVKYPKNGRVEAGHDPRSDGGAAGI